MLLVVALLYNLIGCGLDLRWASLVFFFFLIDLFLPATLWPWCCFGLFNRNEYQGYLLGGYSAWCIGLTSLSPSCADCLKIMAASPSWKHKDVSWSVMGQLDLVA